MALLGSPSAAASMMRARVTNAAEIERERAIDINCERSSSLNMSFAFGRPIAMVMSPVSSTSTCYANIDQLTTERDTS
jgi:hypothetical protein